MKRLIIIGSHGLMWTYYTNSNRIHQNELNRLKSQQAGGRPVGDR